LNIYEGYVPIKNSSVIEQVKPTNKFILERMTTVKNDEPAEADRTLSSLILGNKTKHKE